MHPNSPEMVLNYSPDLDFRIKFMGTGSFDECFFQVRCRLRHSAGHLEYVTDNLCFDLKGFQTFENGLLSVRDGQASEAVLSNVGEMLVFRLFQEKRLLLLSLSIRQSVSARLATLNFTVNVDYDLFINKLIAVLTQFMADLRKIEIENI